jgi:hypothetical protein
MAGDGFQNGAWVGKSFVAKSAATFTGGCPCGYDLRQSKVEHFEVTMVGDKVLAGFISR